jgi:hypothetical protein
LFRTDFLALITDTRGCALKATTILTGAGARLYLERDTAQTPASAARKLGNIFSAAEAKFVMEGFRDARLMAEMDGHYLSLVVWRNRAV